MGTSFTPHTLGIDFGTSNSAAGIYVNGVPKLIEIEAGQTTLPTAVFFDFSTRRMLLGRAANKALIEGQEGRYMRSLKSILGTSLLREERQFMGERLSLMEIISRFLRTIKTRAEASTGLPFTTALSGRPVHFHSADPGRDAQALEDLKDCYLMAGFDDVTFLHEPEAAAISARHSGCEGQLSLIVDIGGGTSDFCLFRPDTETTGIKILASHGVRVGGTDFDRVLSIDHIMPLLGKGSALRNTMGPGTMTAPNAIFNELATWEKIPFLYTHEFRSKAADFLQFAVQKPLFSRLSSVLEHELGHDLAFAVEAGKIQANRAEQENILINLNLIEKGLQAGITIRNFEHSLSGHIDKIRTCAQETLTLAGCQPEQVDRVILVGGSSLITGVQRAVQDILPQAQLQHSNAFTAIIDGLAIASAQPSG